MEVASADACVHLRMKSGNTSGAHQLHVCSLPTSACLQNILCVGQVPVGKETLGRIINVIGEPVDEQGPVSKFFAHR